MLAYIGVNGAGAPAASGLGAAVANPDTYSAVLAGQALAVSDPAKGVIANDINVYGVKVAPCPTALPPLRGAVTLNPDGTFTYVPDNTWTSTSTGSFCYRANGNGPVARVTLSAATIEPASGITCTLPTPTYASSAATSLSIKPPGILSFCKDAAG